MSNISAIMAEPDPVADPWSTAPFDTAVAAALRRELAPLNHSQRMWLSGFLAGSAAAPVVAAAAPSGKPAALVLFGSQSGNCEQLAKRIEASLTQAGLSVKAMDMLDCRKQDLQEAQTALVVVSTHGEGDPPDRARALHELLHGRKAPQLGHLKYSVLALGDSSYEKFCETGRQFDQRLAALGAQRLHDRVECDIDFESAAQQWIENVGALLLAQSPATAAAVAAPPPRVTATIANAYTRKNPYHATVLAHQRLTTARALKDVRHIELCLEGSGIHYEPGDAIGIAPRNCEAEVDELLELLSFDATMVVDQAQSLKEALLHRFDISLLTRASLERYVALSGSHEISALLQPENAAALTRFLHGRHLIDLVKAHPPTGVDAATFVQALRPLAPRLYSIASSLRATPDEAHLTVSLVNYESLGRERWGVVSGQLARLDEDANLPIYLHRNPNFRLPADSNADIIMIGPGTGVAPFRGFVAEREALGARGRHWLFFGGRNFTEDFLYQAEWLAWRKRGVLQHIDVAFSRDQRDKIYVQQRMRERSRELLDWIERGAHVYVCGDAQFMGPDVHRALLDILAHQGGRTPDQAAEHLLQMQRDRRYQRDLY